MDHSGLISVVIPTLNEADNIERLLNSLVNQSKVEIIVSDGGSEDNTVVLCDKFPVRVVSGSRGRGAQLNLGARLASGDIILFMHADSSFNSQLISQIRTAATQGYLWGCATLAFDDNRPFYRVLAFFSNLRARCLNNCYGDQAIWCQRDFFWEIGGFPDYPIMEDIAFSKQAKKVIRPKVLSAKVVSSTRRFKSGGPLRVWLLMQRLKIMYGLGVSPFKLADMYRK